MIGVLIASKAEWKVLLEIYNITDEYLEKYPYGEYYRTKFNNKDIVFFRSGVRKINASASLQYVIDKFQIEKLINIGVCTGANEELNYGDILVPEGIIDYDFIVRDLDDEINEKYIMNNDIPKISLEYKTGLLGTSDKSLITWEDLIYLSSNGISASDMEASAISKICKINGIECIIIKGISDKPIKGESGYDEQLDVYEYNLPIVMKKLIEDYLTEVI